MASSSNRYAALADKASSSKESESQKSVTGPKDQDKTMQDTGSAGPSISMGDLGSSLPKVLSKEEGVKLFLKKRDKFRAEEEEENQRAKKARQSEGAKFITPRTIPSAAPDSDDEMDNAKEFDFRDIANPHRRTRCMWRYEDADGESTNPLGNLSSSTPSGVFFSVSIEAGRYGAAKVSLVVGVNRGTKQMDQARKAGEYSEIEATWRAGIVIEDRKVIETLNVLCVKDFAQDEKIHDKRVVDSCPQHNYEKLAAITMKCNSARVPSYHDGWLDGLDTEVQEGINKLFRGQGAHRMTFWFIIHPNMSKAMQNWGSHLENAVNSNLPSYWQYMAEDGQPIYEIDEIEPISTFQKGMYVRYGKKRGANNMVLRTEDGQPIENKDRRLGYHKFEKQLTWEAPHEFGLFNIISPIRDVQFAKAQVAYLERQHQHVYLQNLGTVEVQGASSYVPKDLKGVFRCFVRQSVHGPVPPPGASITLQWDNSIPTRGQPHITSKNPNDTWWGTVLSNTEESCKATGTHFCAMVTMPQNGRAPRSYPPGNQNLPDGQLLKAHIKVVIDETAVQREIEGMKKFADLSYDTENLAAVRMAIMSDPSRIAHTTTDLTAKNPAVWAAWKNYCSLKYKDNKAQMDIVTSIEKIDNKMAACIGPPGSGKTTVLTDITIGAVLCGHIVLVCAVSNNAVDKAANSFHKNFPENQRDNYRFLRYETTSAEMQSYLTRDEITEANAKDKKARPAYKKRSKVEDDDLIMQTMAEASQLQFENDNLLRRLCNKYNNFEQAFEELEKINARKRSNVPASMTLANRCFLLTQEDQYNAFADHGAEMTAYRGRKLDPTEIDRLRKSGTYRTEAELVALGQDPLDEAEIQARLKDGRIPSQASRDKSLEYRSSLTEYVQKDGKVNRQAKLKFKRLRKEVVIRVLKQTNCVFTTCNNAGSEIMQLGFSPSFINIDETGQLTIPALANVLTSFKAWLAIMLFGDPKQLLPYLISGRANEFKFNAETSVLALLEEKNYPILRLILQYRMAPAISQFVSRFFYNSLLRDHHSVLNDNDLRAKAREISKQHYRLKGPNNDGSEYWMVDVVNGVSRVQLNGTSLQNYANADRIAALVDQTLSCGVSPAQITVLVYYTGQLALVSHKIEMTAKTNGRPWTLSSGRQVSSVDSFQGEENEFVFIDVVTAHQNFQQQQKGRQDVSESEDDEGFEGFKRSGKVTAHVKSPNRLCCALTRGRSCVVVVCQLATLLSTVKDKQSKSTAALGAMARDFLDRNLVYHDFANLDTSPAGEETRAQWDKARQDDELRQRKIQSLDLLNTHRIKAQTARIVDDTPSDAGGRLYRTQARRTTRPNMSGAAVDEAETHDVQNKRTINTEAGPVALTVGSQSQRGAKEGKKAARAKAQAEKKAAEDSGPKGKVQRMPTDPKGKGKEKELPEEPEDVDMGKELPEDPKGSDKGKGAEEPEDVEMGKEETEDPKGKEQDTEME